MNRKIKDGFVALIFTAILLFAMIPVSTNARTTLDDLVLDASGGPVIKIELTGDPYSIGVIANIKNIGDADATDVNWSVLVDGGLIFFGKETTGRIMVLSSGGENATLHSSLIIGIGRTTITISAECAEGPSDELIFEAFIFGMLVYYL